MLGRYSCVDQYASTGTGAKPGGFKVHHADWQAGEAKHSLAALDLQCLKCFTPLFVAWHTELHNMMALWYNSTQGAC